MDPLAYPDPATIARHFRRALLDSQRHEDPYLHWNLQDVLPESVCLGITSLPIMPLVSGIVVLIFGALTLYLHNDVFIKMKPTIINTLFGAILLGGLAFGKSLLGYVFDEAFRLDAEGWRKLTLRWGLFFLFLAVLNEVVWRNFSTDFWVAFKVWATMPITILFTISQMPLIMRHSLEEQAKK